MAKSKWFLYSKKKPKQTGFYYCIVSGKDHNGKKPYHKILFYDNESDRWCDHDRMIMFETYEIYRPTEGPEGKEAIERIYRDKLCIRTDVLYWSRTGFIPNGV